MCIRNVYVSCSKVSIPYSKNAYISRQINGQKSLEFGRKFHSTLNSEQIFHLKYMHNSMCIFRIESPWKSFFPWNLCLNVLCISYIILHRILAVDLICVNGIIFVFRSILLYTRAVPAPPCALCMCACSNHRWSLGGSRVGLSRLSFRSRDLIFPKKSEIYAR